MNLNDRIEWCANILEKFHPQTVRHIYYVAVSEGWLPPDTNKTKRRSYKAIQTALEKGRRRGIIPWKWIVDPGRIYRKHFTEKSLIEFANDAHEYYTPMAEHKSLLWVEKDTIVPTIEDITRAFICPLVSGRGFSGLSHIRRVAKELGQDVERILFIGDHDPSGVMIDESLETNLATDFGVSWKVERIALTWDQAQDLPSIELKPSDSRTPKYRERFGDQAWEVEALPIERLRQIVMNRLRVAWPDSERNAYEEKLEGERAQIIDALEILSYDS